MAREAGRQAPAVDGQAPVAVERPAERRPSLLEQLRSNPRAFSFVQAVRLLRQAHGGADTAQAERFLRERLRVRSLLSLGFPATDLTELEDLPPREGESGPDQDRFRLTATFLGLYGPSSPLPTFYTEELLDEQSEDRSVSRDFLDVVGDGFFTLFFLAWTRHRLSLKAWEERDAATMERLFSLVGLGDPEVRNVFSTPGLMLRSAGLLTQFPRSAAGLRGLLSDRAGAPVTVVQCVSRNVPIPEDQRCILGQDTAQLGASAWLGSEVRDDTGKFRLEVGPLDAETYHKIIPQGDWHMSIVRLVRFYCTEPLEFDVLLRLDPAEAEDARLGTGTWSQLGCDAWLGRAEGEEPRALFTNLRQQYDRNLQRSVAQ
ncbi:MAG: type VI secretion system baseplate subunit TssG [Desulfovibrio sp.]